MPERRRVAPPTADAVTMSATLLTTVVAHVIEIMPDLVREKREREGLSVREAARQTGMSFSTVSRFEARQVDIQTDNLLALLRWVGQPTVGAADGDLTGFATGRNGDDR